MIISSRATRGGSSRSNADGTAKSRRSLVAPTIHLRQVIESTGDRSREPGIGKRKHVRLPQSELHRDCGTGRYYRRRPATLLPFITSDLRYQQPAVGLSAQVLGNQLSGTPNHRRDGTVEVAGDRARQGLISLCPLPSTDTFQYQAVIALGDHPTLCLAHMQDILPGAATAPTSAFTNPCGRHSGVPISASLTTIVLVAYSVPAIRHTSIPLPAAREMNTGIRDAHNLAWKLSVIANGATPALLDSYEAQRKPVAADVLTLSKCRSRAGDRTQADP